MPRAASKESSCATPISPASSRAQTPAHDITGTPARALPGHDPLPGIGQRGLVDPDKASTEPLGSRRGSSPRPVWDVEPVGQGSAVCLVPAPITPIRRFEVVRKLPPPSRPCLARFRRATTWKPPISHDSHCRETLARTWTLWLLRRGPAAFASVQGWPVVPDVEEPAPGR
ncbi:hypothetical protein ColTof4_13390 [Colletotrichum tofieldiae]|nr:hypothetical protein ColTof3_00535 [Colletotrichum tofieldiae]GKT80967.1 hypothetical protein ColTof4_13390 [Colletotrichum tofieldiae]